MNSNASSTRRKAYERGVKVHGNSSNEKGIRVKLGLVHLFVEGHVRDLQICMLVIWKR